MPQVVSDHMRKEESTICSWFSSYVWFYLRMVLQRFVSLKSNKQNFLDWCQIFVLYEFGILRLEKLLIYPQNILPLASFIIFSPFIFAGIQHIYLPSCRREHMSFDQTRQIFYVLINKASMLPSNCTYSRFSAQE